MKLKFETGYVYKIISENTPKIYIGSTTSKLNIRLSVHKSCLKNYENFMHLTSFEILKFGNCKIDLIEEVKTQDKCDLLLREKFWIGHYKDICVNKNSPIKTAEEIKAYHLNYYRQNRDKLLAKAKEKTTCFCGIRFDRAAWSIHSKSKKHLRFVENKETPQN